MKSFLRWIESEETPALSEPQHKKGEANMALDEILEKRMKSIIMDLESSGKGTQQEILKSAERFIKKMGGNQGEKEPAPNQPQQGDFQAPAAGAPMPAQPQIPMQGQPPAMQ